jgi:hypothetical protein
MHVPVCLRHRRCDPLSNHPYPELTCSFQSIDLVGVTLWLRCFGFDPRLNRHLMKGDESNHFKRFQRDLSHSNVGEGTTAKQSLSSRSFLYGTPLLIADTSLLPGRARSWQHPIVTKTKEPPKTVVYRHGQKVRSPISKPKKQQLAAQMDFLTRQVERGTLRQDAVLMK